MLWPPRLYVRLIGRRQDQKWTHMRPVNAQKQRKN